MTFRWITERQRREQEAAERSAMHALLMQQYRQHAERVNRATDEEISTTMDEIHREQRAVRVLVPGRKALEGQG